MKTTRSMGPGWAGRGWFAGRCVVAFGTARLERDGRGRIVLLGGDRRDRQDAKEWASMFLPEAVVAVRARSRCAG